MFNVLYGLVFMSLHFVAVILFYRHFGKLGLFIWIALASVLANIQVVKAIEIFSIQATLGNTLYGSIFLATDILSEKYGSKDANQAVVFGLLSIVVYLFTMQLALFFIPASDQFAFSIQSAFELIFKTSFRIVIASLVAYGVSQFLDVSLYAKIKASLSDDKYLWLRNNGSTLLSQLVDTTIFVSIAFIGLEYNVVHIFISTYLLKSLIALFDTPFIYVAKKIKPKQEFF